MKVSYEYYVDTFKGKICQPEFEDLVEPVIDLVKGYAEQFIAPWALEKNIDYYCLELKRSKRYKRFGLAKRIKRWFQLLLW